MREFRAAVFTADGEALVSLLRRWLNMGGPERRVAELRERDWQGDEEEDLDDGERWLWVVSEGSRAGYRDMELFVAGVAEPDLADRLARALEGRGAFRRFRDDRPSGHDLRSRPARDP